MTTEPWASEEGVAEHLGLAKDSVYRWIEVRSLPANKVGRLRKLRLSEVDGVKFTSSTCPTSASRLS